MAAESLIHSLEDKGKHGTLTRPLTMKHLQTRRRAGEIQSLMKARETWLTCMPAAMSLGQARWVSKLDMQVVMPRQAYILAASRADLWEVLQDCNRLHNVHADMCVLRKTYWSRSKVDAYRSAHPRLPMASMMRQDTDQLAQGIGTKMPTHPLPRTILASEYIHVSVKECNPDRDIVPTGACIVFESTAPGCCDSFSQAGCYAGTMAENMMRALFKMYTQLPACPER